MFVILLFRSDVVVFLKLYYTLEIIRTTTRGYDA